MKRTKFPNTGIKILQNDRSSKKLVRVFGSLTELRFYFLEQGVGLAWLDEFLLLLEEHKIVSTVPYRFKLKKRG